VSDDPSENSVAALVARAVRGDVAAIRALHDEHRAAAYRLARGFADFDADDVDDVVQEAFVRAFDHLDRLEEPGRFKSWFLTIVRNQALTRLTRRQTEREASAGLALEQEARGLHEVHLPDLDADKEVELVRRIVDGLPEGQEKETVRLFYLEGNLSARDIAQRFGVGKSAITMRLERFRAKVRRRILAEVATLRGEESDG
jgi:RNA polymerase sigma-70 factor (ECF subfamily)